MPDDEPLDDARAVGMAAAAAAAKVVETAARAAADHRDRQQRVLPEPDRRQSRADATEPETQVNQAETRVNQAETWAQTHDPDAFDVYVRARMDADTPDGRPSAERALVSTWEGATQPYDSTARRARADSLLERSGVPDEPRKARTTADLLNGADPRTAAAAGKSTRAAGAAPATAARGQTRTR